MTTGATARNISLRLIPDHSPKEAWMPEKAEDMKGRAKEAAGDVTGDESLQREGKVDQASSTVREKVGQGAGKAKELLNRDDDK